MPDLPTSSNAPVTFALTLMGGRNQLVKSTSSPEKSPRKNPEVCWARSSLPLGLFISRSAHAL